MSWFSGLFSEKYSPDEYPRMRMMEYSNLCLSITKSIDETPEDWEICITDQNRYSTKYEIVDKERNLRYDMSVSWYDICLKSGHHVKGDVICVIICNNPCYLFEGKEAEYLYEKFSKLYTLRLEESMKKCKEEYDSEASKSEKALMEKYCDK